ncbi:DUF305 domain-containing protein [Nonomuraea sp. WAC 01424]|uniref:DUF305 domain-containing protein n=1 Tax=Nonomuraea sp. WAC 01424 TaxID=2203200 RepID=UPI000F78A334|nr:DUF305 domain-containing protein [Nonomuraea sp. WAC 01424]RSM98800.1 DUF305 domain-containing protein [Nonomuraea sp. WAC 01424]
MRFPAVLWRRGVLVAVIAVLTLAVSGLGVRLWSAGPPGDESLEAGFARDMQAHHAQAVQMALIVRDRTTDREVRTLAYDIATTQQQQIGQMYAWLDVWGLPQASAEPRMAWMRQGHQNMPGMGSAQMSKMGQGSVQMPGMATREQLKQLEQASGKEAEILFLRLMIPHHQGGVQMAQAAQGSGQPQVRRMAGSILAAQKAEVELMRGMLAARGAAESPSPSG